MGSHRVYGTALLGLVLACGACAASCQPSSRADAAGRTDRGVERPPPAAGADTRPSGGTGASAADSGPPPDSITAAVGPDGLMPMATDCDASAPCAPPPPDPNVDLDHDGFTIAQGDCDDSNALINPGAFDLAGDGIDEDCQDGDATSASCDADLGIDAAEAMMAARAIELCQTTDGQSKHWGVLSARWTTPDGSGRIDNPMMHGLLPSFGPSFAPRAGQRLLAISSGVARAPDQPGYTRDCSDDTSQVPANPPTGFDGSSSSCSQPFSTTSLEDAIALELRVRVPTNVSALSFDSAFFTDEYPGFICSEYNDFFQVIVQPARPNGRSDGDVVFDQDGNPVSVNNSLLRVCAPGMHAGKQFDCPLGFDPLRGTGFEDCGPSALTPAGISLSGLLRSSDEKYGASTGWLNTEFPVAPAEIITLRFTIWDSGDSSLDSLAIIDHVSFRLRDAPPPPTMPKTVPVNPD